MSEMYENMYGMPMDDEDMDMDMEPLNEEEFRATMNGHNGSNLDIIHEKPDDEIDASGSKGEISKSGSGKHESPNDPGAKGQKAAAAAGDTSGKAKKPPKKPGQNGANGNSELDITKKSSENGRKNGSASKSNRRADSASKRPDSGSKRQGYSPKK